MEFVWKTVIVVLRKNVGNLEKNSCCGLECSCDLALKTLLVFRKTILCVLMEAGLERERLCGVEKGCIVMRKTVKRVVKRDH